MPAPLLSVIVPLYNEEDNIDPLLTELGELLGNCRDLPGHPGALNYEIVLVDDGSSDDTIAKVPKGAAAKKHHLRLIKLAQNTGQSAAMLAGLRAAKGQHLALMDGDLQNDPSELPTMLTMLLEDQADLICGYRKARKDTNFKRLQSRIANTVRSKFIGDGIRDTGCSLKVMKRDCRDALLPFTGMHRFIPALIKGAGHRIAEHGVHHRPRQHGESKYGFGNRAWRATMDMLGIGWYLSRHFQYQIKK